MHNWVCIWLIMHSLHPRVTKYLFLLNPIKRSLIQIPRLLCKSTLWPLALLEMPRLSCVYIHFVALSSHTNTKALECIHSVALGNLTLYSALSYKCALNKVSQFLLQTVWAPTSNTGNAWPSRSQQQYQDSSKTNSAEAAAASKHHFDLESFAELPAGVMEGRESQTLTADSPSTSSHFWCHMTLSPLQKQHLARKEKARAIFKS